MGWFWRKWIIVTCERDGVVSTQHAGHVCAHGHHHIVVGEAEEERYAQALDINDKITSTSYTA